MLAVLTTLVIGSLIIVPSLNYIVTNVKASRNAVQKLKGTLAAEVGVEDALWKVQNDCPSSFPYSYQINDVNGMLVSITVDEIDTLAGEEMGSPGVHEDWLSIEKSVTYDEGIYDYTLSLSNVGNGNIKVIKLMRVLPPNVDYVDYSTGGDITTENPTIIGSSDSGITLIWEIPPPLPTIPKGETRVHIFQLSGPPDIEGMEGYGFVEASRQDIGTVWDCDSHPYSIISEARNASSELIATIEAGVWAGSELSISHWQLARR